MDTRYFQVSEAEAGRRLDVVALGLLGPEFSRSQVQRLIRQGCITLAGRPARSGQKVAAGQDIAVVLPPPEPSRLLPEPLELEILYEDADLVVVNKAPGMVVHPAPGHSRGTLVHGLLHHCGELAQVGGEQRPGIVHRLDKDTSGVLVAAKSDRAHRALVAAFAAGRVEKRYLALVLGSPPERGRVEAGIGRHPVDRKRMSSRARHPKPALSRWRVRERFPGLALLEVEIATGRTHQIRVHLSEAGFPVAMDPMYRGRRGVKRLPPPLARALARAGRQMLHARRLALAHPVSGREMEFVAPLPADFRRVLEAARECGHA